MFFTAWIALPSSSATQISPPWGPKLSGTTAGPSMRYAEGPRDVRDSSIPVNPKDVALLARDDHVEAKCAKMIERNPVVVRCEAPRERRKQRDGTYTSTLKTKAPSTAKTSRGVNPAAADCDGAIAMYFSRQEPNPGNVANTVAFPLQSILSMFSEQYSLTSKRSGAAATPVGKGTPAAKGNWIGGVKTLL